MFFTSEITIPFRTIRDVMQAYPDYKLLMMDGMYGLLIGNFLGLELFLKFCLTQLQETTYISSTKPFRETQTMPPFGIGW